MLKLQGTSQKLLKRLNDLQHLGWIDKYTRAVMLEFSVYNANVRTLKRHSYIIVEFKVYQNLMQNLHSSLLSKTPYYIILQLSVTLYNMVYFSM